MLWSVGLYPQEFCCVWHSRILLCSPFSVRLPVDVTRSVSCPHAIFVVACTAPHSAAVEEVFRPVGVAVPIPPLTLQVHTAQFNAAPSAPRLMACLTHVDHLCLPAAGASADGSCTEVVPVVAPTTPVPGYTAAAVCQWSGAGLILPPPSATNGEAASLGYACVTLHAVDKRRGDKGPALAVAVVPVGVLLAQPVVAPSIWLRLCTTFVASNGKPSGEREVGRLLVSCLVGGDEAASAGVDSGVGAASGVACGAVAAMPLGAALAGVGAVGAADLVTGRLEVTVVKARHLPSVEKGQDPYVMLYTQCLGSERKGASLDGPLTRTRVCQDGGASPVWNETVTVALDRPHLCVVKVLQDCLPWFSHVASSNMLRFREAG